MSIDQVIKISGGVLGLILIGCKIRKEWFDGSKTEAQRDLLKAQRRKMEGVGVLVLG